MSSFLFSKDQLNEVVFANHESTKGNKGKVRSFIALAADKSK
jgi:hypothetical protein